MPHVLRSGSGSGRDRLQLLGWPVPARPAGSRCCPTIPTCSTSIPSIFAQVGLHCRVLSDDCPFDVAGFSLASVPGVVIGKNTKIAWGLTTSYVDVQDLFFEDVRGDTGAGGGRATCRCR